MKNVRPIRDVSYLALHAPDVSTTGISEAAFIHYSGFDTKTPCFREVGKHKICSAANLDKFT
jgi:hypothetical protein